MSLIRFGSQGPMFVPVILPMMRKTKSIKESMSKEECGTGWEIGSGMKKVAGGTEDVRDRRILGKSKGFIH